MPSLKLPFAQIAILAMLAASSCSSMDYTLLRGKCGPWLRPNYFGLSREDRIAQFEKLDIDTQYTLFLCASRVIHQRDWETINAFAQGGEANALYLHGKLAKETNEMTIYSIITAYEEMQ